MNFELTALAADDVAQVLSETAVSFGPIQLDAYTDIIERAIRMVADDPHRPGSLDRATVRPGVRMFHLELAAGRSGGAAHCLYYTFGRLSDGTQGVMVLRLLHQRMEPVRALASAAVTPTASRP